MTPVCAECRQPGVIATVTLPNGRTVPVCRQGANVAVAAHLPVRWLRSEVPPVPRAKRAVPATA